MYGHRGHDAAEEERDLHIWQAQTGSGRNDPKVHFNTMGDFSNHVELEGA